MLVRETYSNRTGGQIVGLVRDISKMRRSFDPSGAAVMAEIIGQECVEPGLRSNGHVAYGVLWYGDVDRDPDPLISGDGRVPPSM